MKVKIIKQHHEYPLGEVDVDEDRARYLIGVGVAEELSFKNLAEMYGTEAGYFEKEEKAPAKEKKENKTGNVPTAKKKK